MRPLSSSLCGQLTVREVRGSTEVEIPQPRSCLIPFNFSGSCPCCSIHRVVCDQPGSCPAPTGRDAAAKADFPWERTKTWDLTLLLPRVASGDSPLLKHRQEAGKPAAIIDSGQLTDRAEGRESDTVWNGKPQTPTQPQSPTHPTDQRGGFWRITSGRLEN